MVVFVGFSFLFIYVVVLSVHKHTPTLRNVPKSLFGKLLSYTFVVFFLYWYQPCNQTKTRMNYREHDINIFSHCCLNINLQMLTNE